MSSRIRILSLLLVLVAAGGCYLFLNLPSLAALWRLPPAPPAEPLADLSASLELDDATKSHIRHYFEGVTVEPQENNIGYAGQLDHAVGRAQISRGEYREAYRTYQKVLAISYRQGSAMGIGIALNVMADIAYRADNREEALFATLLAYRVAETMKNKEELGVIELSFARRLQDEDPSLAMMWLLRARESLKDSRFREDYVRALPSLAASLWALHEDEQASRVLEEAWTQAQALGDSRTQAWTKSEVAIAYAGDLDRAGRHARAVEVLTAARALYAPAERNTESYSTILHNLARAYGKLKKPAEAASHYLAAYTNYEVTRADAPGEEARVLLDRNSKPLVDDFVDHFVRAGDAAAALALLESNKARTLSDVFEDPSYREVQDRWKEMERRHAREAADLFDGPGDELLPVDRRDALAGWAALARKQADERRRLQADLQLKETIVTRGISKVELIGLSRGLPADAAVLSFFVREQQVSLFLATRQGIRHLPLSADVKAHRRAVKQLRVALTNPYTDFYREPAQALYRTLLAPAIDALPATTKILVVSPDDLLSRIPLEVLMDGERFLGERFAVYRVPSLRHATAIGSVKAPPARRGIACVDPDVQGARLPFQQEAGRALQKLHAGNLTLLAGNECSENRLVAALAETRTPAFLHIGAHGNFYPADAMDSAIWLTPGEGGTAASAVWNARAMATVDMRHVDLVTLSSCESGLTDPKTPRDVFGIARALFFSGAGAMVAPLWAVDDRATAAFMQAFHAAYARGVTAVHALPQAQGALRRTPQHRHPYYWSAFVLTGGPS